MSLMSLLTTSSTSTGLSSGFDTSAATSAAMQKLLAAQVASTAGVTSGAVSAGTSDVSISAAAQEAADNAKDFTALATEVRATLDAQYKAAGATDGTTPAPDLSGMSGRALAAIALNRDGSFSATEMNAAKTALRRDTQTAFVDAIGSNGTSLTGLATYSQQIVSEYDAMSPEEREARGWTDQFRAGNENFVTQASQSTLFDQID